MKSGHAMCAEAVRKELKGNYPALRFSVKSHTFAGGNSVDVTLWTPAGDLEDQEKRAVWYSLADVIRNPLRDKYVYGRFDAMTDYYDNTNVRDDVPQVKYLFVQPRSK